ncbi:MAG: ferrous iron transport protein B, partial [Bacteroidales bacterium]|nr:ferrous iron transport protein B [Bacteroidales bacterium]
MNVCLLTGLPAKEAIVSTMGILYHASPDEEGGKSLATVLREEKIFSTASSWAFMLFVLLYFPCIATVATLKREIGGRWAAFTVVHSLCLAWVVAFLAFRLISLF